MSERRLSIEGTRQQQWMREVMDRLDRIEHQANLAGAISFSSSIEVGGDIGGVTVEVIDTGGNHRDLVFTNTQNGVSHTVSL